MSFTNFLESKKRPSVQFSLEHYRGSLERQVYDALLDPSRRVECILTHLPEVTDLGRHLQTLSYPKADEMLMAVAAREPSRIRRAHEQFSAWSVEKDFESVAAVDSTLFECRAYLYGKEPDFSKEMADRIVDKTCEGTERNANKMVKMLEHAIGRIHGWHGSSVILKATLPDEGWESSEGQVLVGQPPSMTFMLKNEKGADVYDVQDIEGYPLSIQEDYSNLVRSVQSLKPRASFQTFYAVVHPKERTRFEQVKRELALGIEATLPAGTALCESPPETDGMDVWKVKLKGNILSEASDTPVRWLDIFRKA